MSDFAFGAASLGRLQYRTAAEARGAARDLGLSSVHSHVVGGERIWMPGESHATLNRALRRRGRATVPKPTPATSMAGTGEEADERGREADERAREDVETLLSGQGGPDQSKPLGFGIVSPDSEERGDLDDLYGDEDEDDDLRLSF